MPLRPPETHRRTSVLYGAVAISLLCLAFVAKLAARWLAFTLVVAAGRPVGAIRAPMPRVRTISLSVLHSVPFKRTVQNVLPGQSRRL